MKILLISDAWHPQINGVVRTLSTVVDELRKMGHEVEVVHPQLGPTIACPSYPEIRLSLTARWVVRRVWRQFQPDAIHIATEGPLGMAGRRMCMNKRLPFTTSFHTRFAEYVHARCRVPIQWSYRFLRRFHRAATRTMVATEGLRQDLDQRGFDHLGVWNRGVDLEQFSPTLRRSLDLPRPIHLFVGRLAVEKGIEEFLKLELPGTKLVVGDGPQRAALEKQYPNAVFTGFRAGSDLAELYASSDVFVFPSRTDTFGLVLLEALAAGVPVAALPVRGPLDVIGDAPVGVLDFDLQNACGRALEIDRNICRPFAERFGWDACARRFLQLLAPIERVDADQPLEAAVAANSGS